MSTPNNEISYILEILEAHYETEAIGKYREMQNEPSLRRLSISGTRISSRFSVSPTSVDCPIEGIEFDGFAFLKKGDLIKAYFPKRGTSEIARASKLELISSEGQEVLATFNCLSAD